MPFEPLRTGRLVIRQMTADDADFLWRLRDDPEVARYQTWTLPFTNETAQRMAAGIGEVDGPTNEEWWAGVVEDAVTGEAYGEVVCHVSWEGRSAEVGYSFRPEHWGKGYAVEATDALVDFLFDTMGVTRVFGMLHPDNPASAQVLERVGMLFEGHTRSSFWVGDEVSDDWLYGMTREDRDAWRGRPRQRPRKVRLVEVTWDTFDAVFALRTHKTQESLVAPMPKSLAQAYVSVTAGENYTAWPRAIEADGEVVGFVMVAMATEQSDDPEPFLWRLLVDRLHQRRGVASMALPLVEQELRDQGHTHWKTSWVPGRGSPEPFYLGYGFEPTGEMEGAEVIARKAL